MYKWSVRKGSKSKVPLLATGLVIGSTFVPGALSAETQFSLGAFYSGSQFLNVTNFDSPDSRGVVGMGNGALLRFGMQPNKYFGAFLQGGVEVIPVSTEHGQKTHSDTILSAELGISYNIPLNDRMKISVELSGGVNNSAIKGISDTAASAINGFNASLNVGFSYRINPAISAAVTGGGSFNNTLGLGARVSPGISINLNEAFSNTTRLAVATKEVLPVFPVLYSWYENNSFGSVTITNEEDVTITNINVSFYQQQYMGQPSACAHLDKLAPGESFDAELKAFFNERMLDLTEVTDTKSQVIVEYSYLGQKKTKTYQMSIPVYGRNSMSWDDDRRAAVFVSSKDPAALWFAKYVTSVVRDNLRDGISKNIQYAMGIFETLDQFGLNYVVDPTSAYSDNVGASSIDFLQFPYQTLMYRGGDCDDISILVSSLFEATGIPTAFITIPGHIFMAFDTGLSVAEAEEQFTDMKQLIVRGETVWMPLEITISDEGFNKAWHVGAREWNNADRTGDAAIYPMAENWVLYKPVNVPDASARFTMPDSVIVSKLFQHSLDEWITREIAPVVEGYKRQLAVNDTPEIRNTLGVLYGRYGLFTDAEEQFRKSRIKGYLPSVLNTANILFATKSYSRALQWYKLVLESEPRNEKALLGVARCEYELENYDACDRYYAAVCKLNPSLGNEYSYLGNFLSTKGRSFSLADRLSTIQWDNPRRIKEAAVVEESEEEEVEEPIDISAPVLITLPKSKQEVIEEEQFVAPEINENTVAQNIIASDSDTDEEEDLFETDTGVSLSGELNVIPAAEDILSKEFISAYMEEEIAEETQDVLPEEIDIESILNPEVEISSEDENLPFDIINTTGLTGQISLFSPEDIITVEEPVKENKEVPSSSAKTALVPETSTPAPKTSDVPAAKAVEKAASVTEKVAAAAAEAVETTVTAAEAASVAVETTVAAAEAASVAVETASVAVETASVAVEITVAAAEAASVAVETTAAAETTAAETVTSESVVTESAEKTVITSEPVTAETTVPVAEEPAAIAAEKTEITVETVTAAEETAAVTEEITAAVTEPVAAAVEETSVTAETAVAEQEVIQLTDSEENPDEIVEIPEEIFEKEITAESSAIVPEEITESVEETVEITLEPELPVQQEIIEEEYVLPELTVEGTVIDAEEMAAIPETVEEKVMITEDQPYEQTMELMPDAVFTAEDSYTAEEIDYTQIKREVPRFTEQPSAEWAPDSAYEIESIPGMKSFEEEMGEFQNDKAYLYRDDDLILGIDVVEEKVEKEEKKEEINPFGSYIETLSDEEFMKVMSQKVTAEKLEEIKTRHEEEKLAYDKKIQEANKQAAAAAEINTAEKTAAREKELRDAIREANRAQINVTNGVTDAVIFEERKEEENSENASSKHSDSSSVNKVQSVFDNGLTNKKSSDAGKTAGIIGAIAAALSGGGLALANKKKKKFAGHSEENK